MSPFDPKKKREDFNREDSNRSEGAGYAKFAKDKRARKTTVERVERKPKEHTGEQSEKPRQPFFRDIHTGEGQRPRRSFNPNFDSENRPVNNFKPSFEKGQKPRFEKKGEGRVFDKPGKGKRPSAPKYDKDNYPRYNVPESKEPVRLNRFVAASGICSRREADDLIKSGAVQINGQVVTELGVRVAPTDEVRFKGEVIHGEKKVYIVMNKPKGFVTSLDDPHADKTVMDLIKGGCTERVYPVGRLDKNSLGVLLITNDGDLTKRLTHPSHNKKKVYQVGLDRAVSKADMEQILQGVELEDGPIAADALEYVGESRKEVGIEIHSGRNRIVRRIFESLGYQVRKLDRVYFAGLTKKKLKRGQWRFLSPKEVAFLKSGEYE